MASGTSMVQMKQKRKLCFLTIIKYYNTGIIVTQIKIRCQNCLAWRIKCWHVLWRSGYEILKTIFYNNFNIVYG